MGGFTTVQSVGAELDGDLRDLHRRRRARRARASSRRCAQINENTGDPEQIRAYVRQDEGRRRRRGQALRHRQHSRRRQDDDDASRSRRPAARRRSSGCASVVHAHSSDGARAAIEAGCTSIEHGTFLDDATLELMAQRGAYFDPNFLVLHNYLDNKPKFLGIGNYNEEGFAAMEKGLPLVADVLRARAQAARQGRARHRRSRRRARAQAEEFIYRVKDGGDTPMDAISAAPRWPPNRCAWQIGSARSPRAWRPTWSRSAGNPLDDITAVRRVAFVMKGGKVVEGRVRRGDAMVRNAPQFTAAEARASRADAVTASTARPPAAAQRTRPELPHRRRTSF